jgi:hypothetical protein
LLPWSNGDGARHPGAPNFFTRIAGAVRGRIRAGGAKLRNRIIILNLVAFNSLIVGVLYLGGSQDMLVQQRGNSLLQAVTLMADGIAARLPEDMPAPGLSGDGPAGPVGLDHLRHLRLDAGSGFSTRPRACLGKGPARPRPVGRDRRGPARR